MLFILFSHDCHRLSYMSKTYVSSLLMLIYYGFYKDPFLIVLEPSKTFSVVGEQRVLGSRGRVTGWQLLVSVHRRNVRTLFWRLLALRDDMGGGPEYADCCSRALLNIWVVVGMEALSPPAGVLDFFLCLFLFLFLFPPFTVFARLCLLLILFHVISPTMSIILASIHFIFLVLVFIPFSYSLSCCSSSLKSCSKNK